MNSTDFDQAIRQAASLLKNARHAVVFTGAGISTPSGVPDFRSQGSGLWNRSDPMKVASLTSFRHTPQAFFDWLRPLMGQIAVARPNPAHFALAEMEAAGFLKAVITQNIDALHQKAGSLEIFEVHGSLATLTCPACHKQFPADGFVEPFLRDGDPPLCPACQSILKPDIVLFEEMLPMETWRAAQEHCEQADVLLVAGSSLQVMPAAGLPFYALERGAALIINNFTPTYLDESADVLLPCDVAQALPQLAQACLS